MTPSEAKRLPPVAALCLLLVCGCRGGKPEEAHQARPSGPATRQAEPEVPEEFTGELSAGETEIMVNEGPPAPRAEPAYLWKKDFPCGKLSGICRFVGPLVRRPPPPELADLARGEYAIRGPLKGEVGYYSNIKIRKPRFYRGYPNLHPTHVSLIFRDIQVGRRPRLTPTGFMAIHGYVRGLRGNHGGNTNINFAPLGTRVTFFTYEAYPCTFLLTQLATGKNVFTGRVSYKDEGAERKKDVGRGHKIWIASKPNHIQSPILRQPGQYRVTTKRHPWKTGHLFLVDNPYVEVVSGGFEIKDLPPGKHRMEVWHPAYQPLKKSFEFEIVADETTDLAIELRPPPEVVASPPRKK